MKIQNIMISAAFCALSMSCSCSIGQKTSLSPLHADGKNLKNENGDIVNLRGVNVGGYLLQEFWMTPTSQTASVHAENDIYNVLEDRFGKRKMENLVETYQKSYFTEADFDRIASLGANCIRLPFWWRNIAEKDGSLKKNAFARLDWFVENAAKRGIYVILDMHGLPGSQNGSDHSGVDGLSAKKDASKFFFGSEAEENQRLFYELWAKIAKHFRGNTAVAGYDIMNEPFCTYRYNSGLTADDLHELLWGIYDEAYKTIRQNDSEHIVIFEAVWDPSDLPDPARYGWQNAMYEYHNYLYSDENNAGGGQIANMQKKLDLIAAASYDVPSYMGEFSYFKNLGTWDEGLSLLTDAGLIWTTWTYKTTAHRGNWGLVHHKSDLVAINIEFFDEDELKEKWSRVGECDENTALCKIFETYAKKPATTFSLSK